MQILRGIARLRARLADAADDAAGQILELRYPLPAILRREIIRRRVWLEVRAIAADLAGRLYNAIRARMDY